ncbi:MAG: TIGR02757 family protein [Cytophagales bacterium]|nr:MAG: TIGR02757 family protein [Cytophagales bacterium]
MNKNHLKNIAEIRNFLDLKVEKYNKIEFISNDPILIPHLFQKKQDIEIMGFFAATLAWGQRITIINSCKKLIQLFENEPHKFITTSSENEFKRFEGFVHRTFNDTDLLYFISFFRYYYKNNETLETAFSNHITSKDENIEKALIGFYHIFFDLPYAPYRTHKHIASPAKKSACKRLCMFLRWMVRNDNNGVDFGIWKNINASQLICPMDLHVDRVSRRLNIIESTKTDWQTAVELTNFLKKLDAKDPVKYDFALFGLGIEEKF